MKKKRVLTIMGILMVSAFLASTPTSVAVTPEAAQEDIFLFGTTSLGINLDPQFSRDQASFNINNQIWEGLFAYNLGDPKLRTVPRLAAGCGNWSADAMIFDVPLRQNVNYSNGDPFNASCVVTSFKRLYDLCVYTDNQIREVYFPYGFNLTAEEDPEGLTNASKDYGYILDINNTVALDDYTVRFVLNYPYVVFKAVLCFRASFIMHPNAPDKSYLEFANITQGLAIGTGPYVITAHTSDEATFEYRGDYYRGIPAIKKFKYILYESTDAISQALLDQTLDYGPWSADFLQDMRDAEHMVVGAIRPNTIIRYLGYNNHLISKTMRHVMNMAIDYDYIIDEIINGQATRMTSIVPPGILYHIDCDVPVKDLTAARGLLIDEDFTDYYGLDETSLDMDWIAVAEGNNPVASYSYTYDLGNIIREKIGVALTSDFAKIGIRVNTAGVSYGQYLSKLYDNKNTLDLFIIEWMADYNDPSNYINRLISNTSARNGAQVNDAKAQGLMDNGTKETDPVKRQAIYEELQTHIAEDLQPWAFLFTGFGQNAVNEHITIQRNAMGYQYVFPWGWKDMTTQFTDPYLETWCNEGSPPVHEYWPEVYDGPMMGNPYPFLIACFIAVIFVVFCGIIFKKQY